MASEWYVEDEGRAMGPFNVAQMKAQAAANRIGPETRVRKGQSGPWIAAMRVKGLLNPVAPQQESAKQRNAKSTPHVTGVKQSEDEGACLAPLRNRKRRAIIYVCLVVFIMIGQAPIHKQLFFDLTVGLLIGSYPIVELRHKTIERTIMVFFFPVHKKAWRLTDFVSVETGTEPRITDTIGILVLVFFWYWFLSRLLDHVIPWLGGNYKLFLRHYDDETLLIWQGNNATDYEANLVLLESAGLTIA